MAPLFAATLVTLALAIAAMAARVIAGRAFPNTHVEGNAALRARGVECALKWDRREQGGRRRRIDGGSLRLSPEALAGARKQNTER